MKKYNQFLNESTSSQEEEEEEKIIEAEEDSQDYDGNKVVESEIFFHTSMFKFGIKKYVLDLAKDYHIEVNSYIGDDDPFMKRSKRGFFERAVRIQVVGKRSELEAFYWKLSDTSKGLGMSVEMVIY